MSYIADVCLLVGLFIQAIVIGMLSPTVARKIKENRNGDLHTTK